jgi:hypothetical protein
MSDLEDMVRRIAREEARAPEFVTQRTVEHVVGVESRAYLRGAKAGRFASTKHERLIVARTADVVAYYETRIRLRETAPANNDGDPEAQALARVGARRIAR